MTDVCFICWAIFIISSAIFSCKFWWYCRTESMLSSFASLFLLPVNLQEKRLSKTSSLHGRHYMCSLYRLRVSSRLEITRPLPSFKSRGARYKSVYYEINNMRSTWSEKVHWGYESVVSIRPISSKIQLSVNLKITFIRDVHVWIASHIVRTSIYIVQYRPNKHQTWECC